MTVAVQIESAGNASLLGDQRFYNLLFAAARELGLSKKQAGDAASIGALSVDGVHITVSSLETDVKKDIIVVAKLVLPIDPASIRQLLEINLIATIALHSTIAIDCDGCAILLSLLPVATCTATALSSQISQMALFAHTLEYQITCSL